MVKITFHTVAAQKPEKETDEDRIVIPQTHEELGLPLQTKKSLVNYHCCLIFNLVVFISVLVLSSILLYCYYFLPQTPEDSLFHCRVIYEDSVFTPQSGRHQLEEKVEIHFQDNYEYISVPIPRFGSDPAVIFHDFNRVLTAYYDTTLEKCYIIELNTTLVMPPRSLWEMLVNVEKGMYLPKTYIIQEEMVVIGRVRNTRQLGPFIHRLCHDKETYRLKHRNKRRRIDKREAKLCHKIRHFENTFVVETVICDRA